MHIKRRTEDDIERLFRVEFTPVKEQLANFEEIIQKVDTRLEIMSDIQRRTSA